MIKKFKIFENYNTQKWYHFSDVDYVKFNIATPLPNTELYKIASEKGYLIDGFSFDKYIWSFVGGKPIVNGCRTIKDIPLNSPQSDALSKDLKKTRHVICGFYDPVCSYASDWSGQRSSDHVLAVSRI